MTMLRHPSSWRDALTQSVAYLGKPEVARLIGKSEDIVDKLVNPNVEGYHLPIERALSLDVALVKQGFPAVFTVLLDTAAKAALPVIENHTAPTKPEPAHEMVDRIVCDGATVLKEFIGAEKHKALSSGDKNRLIKSTGLLQKQVAAFRRALWA